MSIDHEGESCAAVLRHLQEFLDGECCAADSDAVRAHLEACERCAADADVLFALKGLVQRCCRASAPDSLRSRIVSQYRVEYSYTRIETQIEADVRRER